ncbi:phosphatidylglycerol lysyltransferase domain-containing protein [Streptomyces flaveolus]|uniref:phosphatidylglycerol lysyltransferase domain-containing protein n=1 Tax=Streptomyces flaveolus TaxID=67297 RepID=UPI0033B852DA
MTFVLGLLGLLGALALLNAAATLFRSPAPGSRPLHGDEEARTRALPAAYGDRDSLGGFATRRDKAVVFPPSGKATVTYRVEAGVCLASGAPSATRRPGRAPSTPGWTRPRRHARAPAVTGASEAGARACARAGPGALQLGDEAILHVPGIDLTGREMRVTRQAVHRVRRTGTVCRIRRHAHLGEREMGRSSAGPAPGGTPRPSAASPWPWTGSAIRPRRLPARGGPRRGRPAARAALHRALGPRRRAWT